MDIVDIFVFSERDAERKRFFDRLNEHARKRAKVEAGASPERK